MSTLPGPTARAGRALEIAVLTAFGALAMLMFLRPIWDIDIFWHIAAGRWMWEQGAITVADQDVFGLDPERAWVSFQWGYQVLVSLIEGAAGSGGLRALRVLHALVMALAFGLLYRTYRRHLTPNPATAFPGLALVLWAFTLLLFQDRINVRPHVFNLLGLSIVLPGLLGGWRHVGRGVWAGWAVTFGLWANLHAGGCFIMLVAWAGIPAAALFEPGRPQWRRALGLWCLCALPALLSPRFVTGNLSALTLVSTTGGTIGEWSAPIAYLFELEDPGLGRLLAGCTPYVTLLTLATLALRGQLRHREPTQLCTALALTALSLVYVRFIHFAGPVWLIFGGWMCAPMRERADVRIRVAGTALAFLALAAMIWNVNVTKLYGGVERAVAAARGPDIDERRFPVAAADFLELTGFEGTVFCHARYGGYLLWRLWPGVRTAIDGRSNVDPTLAEDVLFVHDNRLEQLQDSDAARRIATIYETYHTDAIVLETPVFAPQFADCARWQRVFRTERLEVWFRDHESNAANLAKVGLHPGGRTGCR